MPGAAWAAEPWQTPPTGWASVDGILRRIVAPTFPDRAFDITKYGARPGGAVVTKAIADAIAACAAAGGGRVVVPAGRFVTGAVHLKTGVNLHLEADAVLAFSQDPRDFLPMVFTRFEGVELMNYSPFIYAFEQRNIAITGAGTLDGQADADHWWPWAGGGRARGLPTQATDRPALLAMASKNVPVAQRLFGDGHYMRPNFIQPYRCQNVLVEGVRIVNSPMWEVHPVLSSNVTVRNLRIATHGPNNDGCNPESSRDVLIEGCSFDTGDDCIAIKAGRNDDGRRVNVASENIVIRNCEMKDGHGGVVIGSECTGGTRNVFAEKCRMDSPQLDRVLRFKNNSVRGGVIEHIYMRDITVGQVAEAVLTCDYQYDEGDAGPYVPVLRDVELRNVTSQKSKYAFLLRGYERSPITDVRVIDCRFDGVAEADVLQGVKGMTLTNVRVNGQLRNQTIGG